MNENIKLEVGSTGMLCPYPIASSHFTTSIVGNKIIIEREETLSTDFSNPVNVVREIELTDEEMAQILDVMADLAANKEKYEKNSGEMIYDASYSVKGQLNGVSFDYSNNTELHNRLSEIINNIVKKRFPDIYVEIDEELNKLVEEKISKESDKLQLFNGDNKVNDQAEISEPADDINYIKKDEGKPAPIDHLRKMYPAFFDENGELKEKAVELMDLLIQNYLKSNNNSLIEEEIVGIKK